MRRKITLPDELDNALREYAHYTRCFRVDEMPLLTTQRRSAVPKRHIPRIDVARGLWAVFAAARGDIDHSMLLKLSSSDYLRARTFGFGKHRIPFTRLPDDRQRALRRMATLIDRLLEYSSIERMFCDVDAFPRMSPRDRAHAPSLFRSFCTAARVDAGVYLADRRLV